MKAVGVHVFAGGFTMGVKESMPVEHQLEIHGLGKQTVEEVIEVPFIEAERWENWPPIRFSPCMVYGNPRCTGFSCITSGYGEKTHGSLARQNQDIWDLCLYGVKNRADYIVYESVQQAYTKGAGLREALRQDVFKRKYKVAHVLIAAMNFGCSQQRRRYFMVAYRKGLPFGCSHPPFEPRPTLGEVIFQLPETDGDVMLRHSICTEYGPNSYAKLSACEAIVAPHIEQGMSLNQFANRNPELLEKLSERMYMRWLLADSPMPFSMHCITRPREDQGSPTLFTSRFRMLHPRKNRPITVGEFAALMCWPDGVIPRGPNPFAQMAKGICPPIGKWIADQVLASANGQRDEFPDETVFNYMKGDGQDDDEGDQTSVQC